MGQPAYIAWGYELNMMSGSYKPLEPPLGSWRIKSSALILYFSVFFSTGFLFGFFVQRPKEENAIEIHPFVLSNSTDKYGQLKTPHCDPARNVFFLKTHKCASSTVQNILMRYGDENDLSFILPKTSNYIGHPAPFSESMVPEVSPQFNILCHHLRFSREAVQKVLPKNTVYLSILRNPVSLFRSMYDYYEFNRTFNPTLEFFFQDESSMRKLNSRRFLTRLGRNQMLFDFGYDKDIWDSATLVQKAIEEIDKVFDLVMIMERFDESLILLKHKLCWKTADIVYFAHNMRKKNFNEIETDKLAPIIEKYNAADKMLYDYFHNKLINAINSFGKHKMDQEVKNLHLWNSVWFNHCVKKMSFHEKDIPLQNKAFNSKVYSFVLNEEPIAQICKNLAIGELQFTEKLRSKQMSSIAYRIFG